MHAGENAQTATLSVFKVYINIFAVNMKNNLNCQSRNMTRHLMKDHNDNVKTRSFTSKCRSADA
jgi:hypothetical protein